MLSCSAQPAREHYGWQADSQAFPTESRAGTIRAWSGARPERRKPMPRLANHPLPGTTVDPRYPDTNGRFMGDTDYHSIAISGLREGLEDHFAGAPDVYVATNLVWYY